MAARGEAGRGWPAGAKGLFKVEAMQKQQHASADGCLAAPSAGPVCGVLDAARYDQASGPRAPSPALRVASAVRQQRRRGGASDQVGACARPALGPHSCSWPTQTQTPTLRVEERAAREIAVRGDRLGQHDQGRATQQKPAIRHGTCARTRDHGRGQHGAQEGRLGRSLRAVEAVLPEGLGAGMGSGRHREGGAGSRCRQPPNASRSGSVKRSIALAPNIRQSPAAMGNSTRRVRRRAATACGRVPPDRALGDQLSTLAWTRGTGGAPSESS